MNSSNVAEEGEEAVDEPVDDPVEGERRLAEAVRAALVTLPRFGEGGAVVAPHGDEVALGVEAVDLDEVVLVGRGAVDDEEDEVVVLVELGPLPEVHRVLDRERVEPEYLAEEPEQLVRRAVEVEPPEALLAGEPLEQRAVDADVLRAAAVDEMSSHPEHRSPRTGRRCFAGARSAPRGPRAAGSIDDVVANGDPVVLVAGVRTAIGRFGGALKDVDAYELGAACIREALARARRRAGRGRRGRDGPGRPGRARRLQRAPLRARRRAAADGDGDEREPALLVRPPGDRHGCAGDPHGTGDRRRRRGRRVDEPPAVPRLPRARRVPAGLARGARRHALARHRSVRRLSHGHDGRARRGAVRGQPRGAGRVRGAEPAACRGRDRRRPLRCGDRPHPPARGRRAVRARRASAGRHHGRGPRPPAARLPRGRQRHGRELGGHQRRRGGARPHARARRRRDAGSSLGSRSARWRSPASSRR